MPIRKRIACVGLAALAGLPWMTAAAEQSAAASPPASNATEHANPFGLAPLARNALASQRGGTNVLNDMKLNGVVADNQASHVTTGANLVGEGAFSGASGLPTVIQNSGNNVLIQNATIVNVQMK